MIFIIPDINEQYQFVFEVYNFRYLSSISKMLQTVACTCLWKSHVMRVIEFHNFVHI